MKILVKKRSEAIALPDGQEDQIMAMSCFADSEEESVLLTNLHRVITQGGRIDIIEQVEDENDLLVQRQISTFVPPPPSEESEPTTEGLILP